jgi:two-component system, chemotaxis family, response regulator Rcp1
MKRTVEVLLVEDNPADQRLTLEGLKNSSIVKKSHVVENGEDAMSFLKRKGKFSNSPVPDLILLDLNLPRKDGREVLAEVKQDPTFRLIPVIVMTTSNATEDVKKSYSLGANCFLTKPSGLDDYLNLIKGIEDFWFSLATLPSAGH